MSAARTTRLAAFDLRILADIRAAGRHGLPRVQCVAGDRDIDALVAAGLVRRGRPTGGLVTLWIA